MNRIEKNKEYSIMFMPNINDLKNSILNEKVLYKTKCLYNIYVSLHLNSDTNKIEPIRINTDVYKFIQLYFNGFYRSTEDGHDHILSTVPFESYLYHEGSGEHIVDFDFSFNDEDKSYYLKEGFVEYNNIEYVKPLNIFDINKGYVLKFDTFSEGEFMEINDLRIEETNPIYKEGDDKQAILDMYKNVSLESALEEIKTELGQDYTFGTDIKKSYYENISN